MISKIVFEDTLVLYWDRSEKFKKGYRYCVQFGGSIAYTQKTHFTIDGLVARQKIKVAVSLVDEKNNIIKEYEKETIYLPWAKKRLDVSKAPYFAVGDGKTLNTQALQKAFDDCKADEAVYIPQGVFLTGALNMHGDSEVYVEKGGVLQGTANPEDYLPKIRSRYEGWERDCYRSLINIGEIDAYGGYTTKNIIIRGKGAILGGGRPLMESSILRETGRDRVLEAAFDDVDKNGWRSRGRLLNINNTQGVVIHGLELGMGASWNIHMVYCDNVVTADCYIHSENVNNGDGWNPDSSTNCTIFNCDFNTRDDMIAIKSGKNPEGNIVNRPSKNIRVFDCRCTHGHGLAVGSEISGGVDGVFVWDCEMEKSRCGMEIKARSSRGGYVKNVCVYNSSFSILALRSVEFNADGETPAPYPPVLGSFYFEDIVLTGVCLKHNEETWDESAVMVEGFKEPGYEVKNVTLKNICIKNRPTKTQHQINIQFAKGVMIENITSQ